MSWFFKNRILVICCLSTFGLTNFGPGPAFAAKGIWLEEYEFPYSNLVQGGQEGSEDFPTYVCRADLSPEQYSFMGELTKTEGLQNTRIPGKFIPGANKCFMSLGNGAEKSVSTFKVLLDKKYRWVTRTAESDEDTFGKNKVVEAGFSNSGEKLFICRTKKVTVQAPFGSGRSILIGTTGQGWGNCIASLHGRSKAYKIFEILVEPKDS